MIFQSGNPYKNSPLISFMDKSTNATLAKNTHTESEIAVFIRNLSCSSNRRIIFEFVALVAGDPVQVDYMHYNCMLGFKSFIHQTRTWTNARFCTIHWTTNTEILNASNQEKKNAYKILIIAVFFFNFLCKTIQKQ